MKGGRKILIMAGALAILIAAVLIFILTNINGLVKAAIERYGSEVTKTAICVSSVSIHLASGKGAVAGLTVANPPGFSSHYVFRLGTINARIDPSTVTTRPIVIDDIRISAPQVVYEINPSGTSNIGVLKKNIEGYKDDAPQMAQGEQKPRGEDTKFIIRKLVIESGRIDVSVAALGDKPKTIALQRIELTDLGKPGGATPSQLAQQVMSALVEDVGREVARAGAERYLEKGIDRAVKRLLDK
ncbi:MAG TPA: hypothetical protein VL087_01225 [Nitrospirota bacterium]|nr:hypothetical protein [Nitrospirota bacterium]